MRCGFGNRRMRMLLCVIITALLCTSEYVSVKGETESISTTSVDDMTQAKAVDETESEVESESIMDIEMPSEAETQSEGEQETEVETETEMETETESETQTEAETEEESETEVMNTQPQEVNVVSEIQVTGITYEQGYRDFDGWKLTNGDVEIRFSVNCSHKIEEAYYTINGERKGNIVLEDLNGKISLNADMQGEISIYCVDGTGKQFGCQAGSYWIDVTAPHISINDMPNIISLMPNVVMNVNVEDGLGSGLALINYQLDGQSVDVLPENDSFALSFDQAGKHEIIINAQDQAGNVVSVQRMIEVKNTPVISVTLPTDIEVVVLSQPIMDGVNLFSETFEVVNRSNVPVKITIAEYEMISEYKGGFGNSFLYMDMVQGLEKISLPLGFMPLVNVDEFVLAASQYSQENIYISSGRESIASCTYRGFADAEFNDFLRYNKAKFRLVFVFEPME